MPNIDEGAKAWQMEFASRVGGAVREFRKRRGWTAMELARRTTALGYPISRVAISKIESNARSGKLDISELVVLAAALGVPPIMILYPDYPYGPVEMLPLADGGGLSTQTVAVRWFSGEQTFRRIPDHDDDFSSASVDLMKTVRKMQRVDAAMLFGRLDLHDYPEDPESDAKSAVVAAATEQHAELSSKAARLWERVHGMPPPALMRPSTWVFERAEDDA